MNPVHFSSATDDWATPQDFFEKLNAEFRFTLDVCASDGNAKANAPFPCAVVTFRPQVAWALAKDKAQEAA